MRWCIVDNHNPSPIFRLLTATSLRHLFVTVLIGTFIVSGCISGPRFPQRTPIIRDVVLKGQGQDGYQYDLRYPQLDGGPIPSVQDSINTILAGQATAELEEIQKHPSNTTVSPSLGPQGVKQTYSIRLVSRRLLSVVFRVELYGGARAFFGLESVNVRLDSGQNIGLADLFRPQAPYLDLLSTAVKRELKIQNEPLERSGDELAPSAANFRKFALTNQSLELLFDMCELLACVAGDITVAIPYKDLQEFETREGPLAWARA
jgi:Protein of unknown function (DUF3298)